MQPEGQFPVERGGAALRRRCTRARVLPAAAAALALTAAGCGGSDAPGGSGGGSDDVLTIGAIPDQDPQELQRRYETVADYLSEQLDVEVVYEPVTDYTASVTAFRRGDLDLVFYGGLTGVQAREQVPDAEAIAQRDIDADFHSVFIASTDSGIEPIDDVAGLEQLAGHTLTFGSEVSTSGRLMPQFFLDQAGVALEDFEGQVGFSDSHDQTAQLVQSGSYEVGVLNEAVWDERREAGKVDEQRVQEVFRTPPYNDYHWVIRPDVDEQLGEGLTERVTDVLLATDGSTPEEEEVLDLFQAGSFVPTEPSNYERIEEVGRETGLLGG